MTENLALNDATARVTETANATHRKFKSALDVYFDLNSATSALAEPSLRVKNYARKYGDRPEMYETFGPAVGEALFYLIELADKAELNLAEVLEAHIEKMLADEKKRAKKARKAEKRRYDALPKYHSKESGLNPLREDGLYGKAAQAADGDWYSSH